MLSWLSSVSCVYCQLWLGAMRFISLSVKSVWVYLAALWCFVGTRVGAIELDITDRGKTSLYTLSLNQDKVELIKMANRQYQKRRQPARQGPRQFLHRQQHRRCTRKPPRSVLLVGSRCFLRNIDQLLGLHRRHDIQ